MTLAIGVLYQHEATRLNVAHLSVTRLVLDRTIQPDGQVWFWNGVPGDLAHSRWDMCDANAGRRVHGCHVERHGIRVHRPLRRRQVDLTEMRLTITAGIDAQALHAGGPYNRDPKRNNTIEAERAAEFCVASVKLQAT